MQNRDVAMTKEAYFDMCDMIKSEPLDSEIPLDMSDFPSLVQNCFVIYSKLADVWDHMNGNYCGKDYSIIFSLFDLYDVETKDERILSMEFLQHMDITRTDIISHKIKAKKPAKK